MKHTLGGSCWRLLLRTSPWIFYYPRRFTLLFGGWEIEAVKSSNIFNCCSPMKNKKVNTSDMSDECQKLGAEGVIYWHKKNQFLSRRLRRKNKIQLLSPERPSSILGGGRICVPRWLIQAKIQTILDLILVSTLGHPNGSWTMIRKMIKNCL